MPLLDFNKKETWDSLYRVNVNGKICHYEKEGFQNIIGEGGKMLAQALEPVGLQKGHRIAFIGSGFAWIAEQFIQCGYNDVLNFDISKWIHANKQDNAVLPIIDADITTPDGMAIAQSYGPIDWIISEDVLPILNDTECQTLCTAMRQITNNVVHWLTPKMKDTEQVALCNWKFLPDWKSFVTPDYIVQRGRDQVI